MRTRLTTFLLAAALVGGPWVAPAAAQREKPRPQPRPAAAASKPQQSKSVQIGGFAMVGNMTFTAKESFDAILGAHSGPIYGGGAHIGLPWGGLFAEVGAWRYQDSGERVFVYNGTTIPLGIHTDVKLTPIELSAGWRFRFRKAPKIFPYLAGGYTSMRYQETSDFADKSENVDDNFGGYHLYGGAEYKITKWFGVAGELAWTTIPNSIGEGGVSQSFNEDNLGGTSFRFKITVGR